MKKPAHSSLAYSTEAICDTCWFERRVKMRPPFRLKYRYLMKCYYCGEMNMSGIFVRVPITGAGKRVKETQDASITD